MTAQDSENLFIAEVTFHAKGGPPRHLQYEQDEWFYVLEGEFIFEVGFEVSAERGRLTAGDSLLAPLRVPHVWAFVGEGTGRILTVCMPAGKVEAFFREISKVNAPPASDPEVWRAYGMEYLGPPLPIAPMGGGRPRADAARAGSSPTRDVSCSSALYARRRWRVGGVT
ncbi:MAG TPA: cupin domain-containing protein [Ktedonobacterales bacterium]|nr:cupin domain-containing protein [Ktedonobacterales bacterium]